VTNLHGLKMEALGIKNIISFIDTKFKNQFVPQVVAQL
jgi:hypothetical protein